MTARVLVVVIGQLRAHRLSWPSFRERVLQPLEADLAVCVGQSPGNDDSNPYWANASHRWVTEEFEDFGEGLDALQRKYLAAGQPAPDWRMLMRVGDQWLGGIKGPGCQPGSAGILLYSRPQPLLQTMGFCNGWNLEKFLFLHFRQLRLRLVALLKALNRAMA